MNEPALGSPGYFERVLGVAVVLDGPEYRCTRESFPDISLVVAYQLPPDAVERLRSNASLLENRPLQLDYEQDHELVRWSREPPTGEAAYAIQAALTVIPYVQGGECTGPFSVDRVRSELSSVYGGDILYSVQYKRIRSSATFVIDSIDLRVLNLATGRFYLVVSDG